jgi:hypothetical protein
LLEQLKNSTTGNDVKLLISQKVAAEEENQKLKRQLDEKFT